MAGQNSPTNQVAPSSVVNEHTISTTKPQVAITIDHLDKNTLEYLKKLAESGDMPHVTIFVYKRDIDNGFAAEAKALDPQHIHLGIHPENVSDVEYIYDKIREINKSNEEITLSYHGGNANGVGQPSIKSAIDTLNTTLKTEGKPPITHVRTTTVEKDRMNVTSSNDNIIVIDYNHSKESAKNLIEKNPNMTHTLFFHIKQKDTPSIKEVLKQIEQGNYKSVPFGQGNYIIKMPDNQHSSNTTSEKDTFSTGSDKVETPENDMVASVSPAFDKWLEENISSQYDNTNDNGRDIDLA